MTLEVSGSLAGASADPAHPKGYWPDTGLLLLRAWAKIQTADAGSRPTRRPSARPGYGEWMAEPRYWRPVLEKRPDFKLVLAHSGGGDAWFGKKEWAGSFDEQAYELCLGYPGVYCDFGMSVEILTPEGKRAFKERLRSLAEAGEGGISIFDKIIYGSDWHMMARIEDRENLVCRFAQVFSELGLPEEAAKFFGRNAERAFGLGER